MPASSLFSVVCTGNGADLVGHLPFKQVVEEGKTLEFDANGTWPPPLVPLNRGDLWFRRDRQKEPQNSALSPEQPKQICMS